MGGEFHLYRKGGSVCLLHHNVHVIDLVLHTWIVLGDFMSCFFPATIKNKKSLQ